jgi:hypothetical protein
MIDCQEKPRRLVDPSEVGSLEEQPRVSQRIQGSQSQGIGLQFQGISGGTIDQSQSTEVAPVRWRNRRRMAWIAMLSCIAVTLICIFYVEKDKLIALEDILVWYFLTMSGIVLGYMGFTTLPSLPMGRK